MRKLLVIALCCGYSIALHAQFSLQVNPSNSLAVDILYTAPVAGQGLHAAQTFGFAIQLPNPEGASLTATFAPAAPLAGITGAFDDWSGTDYGYTTFAWTSTGVPNYSNTFDFQSEVVLGTVTFSGSFAGIAVSAIDYQNQNGGSTDNGYWYFSIDPTGTDVTDYANLFYQSASSDAPTTDNDGGVSNQRLSLTTTPLPIALSDFTAQLNDRHTVDLNWVTQTEVNSKGFDIERSSNGRDFQKIAFVSSKATDGNSTAKLVYASEDLNPVTGDNYYRLKEISRDGKATYSVVRKVIVSGTEQLISLYPNPANSFVNIKGLQEGNMIRVYDMTGKMILEKKAAESQLMQIDVSGIANGNYQVAVFSNDSRVFTGKLVKHD